jgi:hypothetical protein
MALHQSGVRHGATEQRKQCIPVVVGSRAVAPDMPTVEALLHHDDLPAFP